MPRPAKTTRRQIINAGIEYKKGNRKEAYEMWAKAAAERKQRREQKRNKKKAADEQAAAAKTAAAQAASEEKPSPTESEASE